MQHTQTLQQVVERLDKMESDLAGLQEVCTNEDAKGTKKSGGASRGVSNEHPTLKVCNRMYHNKIAC